MDARTLTMIIVVQALFWGTLLAIVYIYISARNRERLALIENGVDASIFKISKSERKYEALKWGLVIVFLGIGVFVGGVVMNAHLIDKGPAFISMPLIFGGLGLLSYYFLVKDKPLEEPSHEIMH